MNYEGVLAFLAGRLNYERRGMPETRELRLDRTAMLLELAGRPHDRFRVVHVAGTKGKGSTCHMIAAMLSAMGLRVGLHTSPHFHRIEERFRVDGQCAAPEDLAALAEEFLPWVAEIDERLEPDQPALTFFEITTAMMLHWFAQKKVDWAVVEVGMGGRLDSTNVVLPEVAVITSISRDHTRQLGERLEQIAREKAGILKPGRTAISGATVPDARTVIAETADRLGCPLKELDRDFRVAFRPDGLLGGRARVETWRRRWPEIALPLFGEHHARNLAVAAAALDALAEPAVDGSVDAAARAVERLRIPGRGEVVGRRPTVVLDVAHNDASIGALIESIGRAAASGGFAWRPRIGVFGVSRDKDWKPMLAQMAAGFDHLVLTTFVTNPRALPPAELAEEAAGLATGFTVEPDPAAAYRRALDLAHSPLDAVEGSGPPREGLVCITGSFYLVAEIKTLLGDPSAVAT